MDDKNIDKNVELLDETNNKTDELMEILNNENLNDEEKLELLKKNLNIKSLGFNTKKHFGRAYKAKRKKKNKMARKSRKANR